MDLDNIFTNLIQDTWNVCEWFAYNSMEAHLENFQFIVLGNIGFHTLQIRHITTKSVWTVSLLSSTIDSKLKFKKDVNNITKKAYYKLYSLRRLRKFLL